MQIRNKIAFYCKVQAAETTQTRVYVIVYSIGDKFLQPVS